MKIKNKISILGFHSFNLILISFYLYPGSILGCYLNNNCHAEVLITENFMISTNYWISSNHFYVFTVLSVLGISTYQDTIKKKFLITYLFFLSIILEFLHLIIPARGFEWSDLFGNILGIIFVIIVYKIKNRYA